MVYQKDLGKVKGDRGNSFEPQIRIENNKVKITWTERRHEDITEHERVDYIDFPIFVPVLEENGDLHFVRQNASSTNESTSVVNIRGPDGADGQMKIRIQKVIDSHEFFDNMQRVDYTYFPDDNTSSFTIDANYNVCYGGDPIRSDTLYVARDGQYVYFIDVTLEGNQNQEETKYYTATKLEGISLDNYYTKQETYSTAQMDNMFTAATDYTNWILGLLDIENPTDYIENTTNYYTKSDVDALINTIEARIDELHGE